VCQHHARKASVFNMHVQYYNRRRLPPEDELIYNVTYCETLEDLLRTSDVISVSCPLDATTKWLLSHKEFAQMKDGTLLVNTARGAIIDEHALIAALESAKLLELAWTSSRMSRRSTNILSRVIAVSFNRIWVV
jgi:lactate dehydrogenase-like 2-hydroxyacid dehydrogenase